MILVMNKIKKRIFLSPLMRLADHFVVVDEIVRQKLKKAAPASVAYEKILFSGPSTSKSRKAA